MHSTLDKHALVQALVASLEDEILRATQAANRTREGAIHEEARPENDKDTRALEASYLARGQAQRVVDLQGASKRVAFMGTRDFGPDDPIDLSALILLEGDDAERWYLLAPAGGGRRLEQSGTSVDVITPEAPLGKALVGRFRGEEVRVQLGARARELRIVEVR
ncbi:MAG TPA: GreA/GreB family elongation factor [Polyangiales bacterium]